MKIDKSQVLIALFTAVILLVLTDWSNCDGQYVRGLFWFECIK